MSYRDWNTSEGEHEIIGIMMQNEERDDIKAYFFHQSKHRGLKGTALVISDAHKGLVTAIRKTFTNASCKMPSPFFSSYLEGYLKKELKTV